MESGFTNLKDILEVIVIPLLLALIAILWPWLQNAYRRKRFKKLIFRELEELRPVKLPSEELKFWGDYLKKDFVHKAIFENPSENRDFILSLPPALVYYISQLWNAKKDSDGKQWVYFLKKLSCYRGANRAEMEKILKDWEEVVIKAEQFERLGPML